MFVKDDIKALRWVVSSAGLGMIAYGGGGILMWAWFGKPIPDLAPMLALAGVAMGFERTRNALAKQRAEIAALRAEREQH